MIPIEYLRECFELDAENGKLFWKKRPREHFTTERGWRVFNSRSSGNEAFTAHSRKGYRNGAIRFNGRSYSLQAHRVIFAMVHGYFPEHHVDHIDGDQANNRPDNLREATNGQNRANSRLQDNNSLRLKGVYREGRKFRAVVTHNSQKHYLGVFETPQEAAAAYAAAAHKYHGEFARIN